MVIVTSPYPQTNKIIKQTINGNENLHIWVIYSRYLISLHSMYLIMHFHKKDPRKVLVISLKVSILFVDSNIVIQGFISGQMGIYFCTLQMLFLMANTESM